MSSVYEYLGYDRMGLPYASHRDFQELKSRVHLHHFSPKSDCKNSQGADMMLWLIRLVASTIARQEKKKTKVISQKKSPAILTGSSEGICRS